MVQAIFYPKIIYFEMKLTKLKIILVKLIFRANFDPVKSANCENDLLTTLENHLTANKIILIGS